MKRIGIIGLLVISFFPMCHAQDIYLGAGYTASFWPLSGLNNVLTHYQEVRMNPDPSNSPEQEYSSSVGDINLLGGLTASFGYLYKPETNLEVKYMNRRNTQWTSVVETASGESFNRNLSVNTNSFGFGISKLLLKSKRDHIIGGTVNFTSMRMEITEGNTSAKKTINESMIGVMGFMKFIFHLKPKSPLAISINPYAQINLIPADFSELNKTMNPNTSSQLSGSELRGGVLALGIEVQLVYFVYTSFNKGE